MWLKGKYGNLLKSEILSESTLVNIGNDEFTTDVVVKFTYKLEDLQIEKNRIAAEKAAELEKAPSSDLIQQYEAKENDIDSAINN